MNDKAHMEVTRKVAIPNETEYHWTIAPDRNGMNVVEIIYWEDGKQNAHMTFAPDAARLIAKAMLECSDEVEVVP